MSSWLDPFRQALDTAAAPIPFFCRDDDIGWGDDRLFALLGLFAAYAVPIDLAVIPQALTPALARQLCAHVEARSGQLGLHQHGFAHANHELTGRKCEFGPGRSAEAQQHDIALGQQQLQEFLGPHVRPIFTPPWNRCTAVTGHCLVACGFRSVSRDASAAPLEILQLYELPVRVDWFAQRKGVRLPRAAVGTLLAHAVHRPGPVGIMFHHTLMDADERQAASELLAVLAAHPQAQCSPMLALVADAIVK